MSVNNNDELKNKFLISEIEETDTLSQFMEKCNNNFSTIFRMGGGPDGARGNKGDQGNPTKPKVPIHVWKKGVEYDYEKSNAIGFEINECIEDLSDVKYQEGHLIILENAHLYQLELDNNFNLKPKFIIELLSFDPSDISNGKNSYIHIAYANDIVNYDGFITDQQLRNENYEDETEQVSTFDLNRTVANNVNVSNMPYMGIYSDNKENSSTIPYRYTWVSIQGRVGETGPRGPKGDTGPKGDKGDKGDSYTGHPFTVDLEGDMSTISIDIDRTRLYDDSDDYCECIAHAYYGKDSVKLNAKNISILLSDDYMYDEATNEIYSTETHSPVGEIKISEINNSNNVSIKFTPDESFVFPKKTMIFPIHIEREIVDGGKTYKFERDTIWSIRGIMSTFELEIVPQYKSIKLDTDGKYYPEKLFVDVYKVEDAVRTLFDIKNSDSDNDGIVDFTLLYKDYDSNEWSLYPDDGVDTKDVSCLEFKVVRYYGSNDPEKPEEVWDYEDVWVVSDGKSAHYYHADLGNTESMMILTTGDKITIDTKDGPKYCAELRNSKGYTITFEPKFYDGTEKLTVTDVNIGTNSGEIYYIEGTFDRELTEEIIDDVKKYKLTIKKVPYGVDVIPMNIDVFAGYDNGNTITDIKKDTVSFNLYITTLTDTYTLVPSVSSFNTSTGKTGDTISCAVYKNNTLIEFSQIPTELQKIGLELKYAVHNEKTTTANIITYTEPIIFGDDDDIPEDEFTSSDVAIVFILYYNGKEIVRSTVPLIKDGIDGADGDCWQYIFCRSPRYPFEKTGISNPNGGISNPNGWENDPNPKDSNSEYLGDNESDYPDDENLRWYDDHKGIDSIYKYEYQAYRKWDKTNKCWGKYGAPTLYSNYSESGSGYSVILSNPIAVIPVGYNDWSVDENAENQSDSTLVYLYNTTKDISKDTNISISIPENLPERKYFTIEKENGINKVTFTPVANNDAFDFGSNTQYKLPITLTYDLGEDADGDSTTDKFTTTINWTLSPMKGLEDVEVFVNKRVVNTSISNEHPLKVGYYLNFSNGVKITVDIADPDKDNEKKNTKKYQIKLTNDISKISDVEPVTDWQNASYNFIDDNGNKRNCYVVLVDSDGKTIIDYIDVVPVSDGNEGKPGSGKIPYYAGVYNNDTTYSQTDTSTPYVFYNDENNGSESGYYLLIYTENDGISPVKDTEKKIWNKMTEIESIYSNIGIFKQALVGKSVFHGDWIFSQDGCKYNHLVYYNGEATGRYKVDESVELYTDSNVTRGINLVQNTENYNWNQISRQLSVFNYNDIATITGSDTSTVLIVNEYDVYKGEPYTYLDLFNYRPSGVPIGTEFLAAICTCYFRSVGVRGNDGRGIYINLYEDSNNSNSSYYKFYFVAVNTSYNNGSYTSSMFSGSFTFSDTTPGTITVNGKDYTPYYYDLDYEGKTTNGLETKENSPYVFTSVKARRFYNSVIESSENINTILQSSREYDKMNMSENGSKYYIICAYDKNNDYKPYLSWSSYLLKIIKEQLESSLGYEKFNPNVTDVKNSTEFVPNWAVNLRSGSMWTGGGSNYMLADGSGCLAGGKISWDTDGNFYLPPFGTMSVSVSSSGDMFTCECSVTNSTSLTPKNPVTLKLKVEGIETSSDGTVMSKTDLLTDIKVLNTNDKFPYLWSNDFHNIHISDAIGINSYSKVIIAFYIDNIPVSTYDITKYVSISYTNTIVSSYGNKIEIALIGHTLEFLENESNLCTLPYIGVWDDTYANSTGGINIPEDLESSFDRSYDRGISSLIKFKRTHYGASTKSLTFNIYENEIQDKNTKFLKRSDGVLNKKTTEYIGNREYNSLWTVFAIKNVSEDGKDVTISLPSFGSQNACRVKKVTGSELFGTWSDTGWDPETEYYSTTHNNGASDQITLKYGECAYYAYSSDGGEEGIYIKI